MNTKHLYSFILLLCMLLSMAACTGKRTEKTQDGKQGTESIEKPAAVTPSDPITHTSTSTSAPASAANTASVSLLPDTTGAVKGYQTQKYLIRVEQDGTYTVTLTSKNLQLIFVIQDAQGNNVIDETSPAWTGELKKGDYTLIVGLMRNAARREPEKEVKYTIQVKRNPQ